MSDIGRPALDRMLELARAVADGQALPHHSDAMAMADMLIGVHQRATAEVIHLRGQLDQVDADATRARADAGTLRARLAECERERDEFHAMLKSVVDYAADDMGTGIRAVIGADAPLRVVRSLRAERDAAIQRAATAEGKLRETTYAALAARGQAEADTVAGIANYVRRRDPAQVPYPDLCASIADRIESYAWRGKEGA